MPCSCNVLQPTTKHDSQLDSDKKHDCKIRVLKTKKMRNYENKEHRIPTNIISRKKKSNWPLELTKKSKQEHINIFDKNQVLSCF